MSQLMLSEKLAELRQELGKQLVSCDEVAATPGVATGWAPLDQFLPWHGFPKGSLTLCICKAGGSSSLWIQAASALTRQKKWAAWVDGPEASLTPWSLRHRQADLSKLLYVSPPQDTKQTLWVLQELMSLCLFDLIGCDLDQTSLKQAQVLKMKKLALRYQTALVFFTRSPRALQSPFYSLILDFERHKVNVTRALHRPTPHSLERRDLYADTLPQLAAGHRALCG